LRYGLHRNQLYGWRREFGSAADGNAMVGAEARELDFVPVVADSGSGAAAIEIEMLKGYSGVLQTDGYAGYRALADPKRDRGPVTLALCWAHWRRQFFDLAKSPPAPIARRGPEAHCRALRDRSRNPRQERRGTE
jgi:hypothetical protein